MNLDKYDKTWLTFCSILSVLLLAAVGIGGNMREENETLKLEIVSKNAQIQELQRQIKSVNHRTDLINLCKVLMEGIDNGKCDNMYNPKIGLEH